MEVFGGNEIKITKAGQRYLGAAIGTVDFKTDHGMGKRRRRQRRQSDNDKGDADKGDDKDDNRDNGDKCDNRDNSDKCDNSDDKGDNNDDKGDKNNDKGDNDKCDSNNKDDDNDDDEKGDNNDGSENDKCLVRRLQRRQDDIGDTKNGYDKSTIEVKMFPQLLRYTAEANWLRMTFTPDNTPVTQPGSRQTLSTPFASSHAAFPNNLPVYKNKCGHQMPPSPSPGSFLVQQDPHESTTLKHFESRNISGVKEREETRDTEQNEKNREKENGTENGEGRR
ncbi:uncharacterized protein DDB_G0290685-like [Homarus americanus]|uniref:uncharacterized protein DDB_G0290685-like n=1 Tax=Homarus americanus TaxID=6706 RepID=UPI001C485F52|nr:uncharacterized protein DDB_G0290685-like [Homarus americanus]